jgi:hypothetical protein
MLPSGWTKEFSRSQQREYFYHAQTKRSVWSLEDVLKLESATKPTTEEEFRKNVTETLLALKEDEKQTSHRFPPCNSEQQYIIHEIGLDLNFVTHTEGTGAERSIIAYKFGFAPEEETITVTIQHAKKKKRPTLPPKVSDDELQMIGTEKRDRRTIEELELAKKNEKKASTDESGSAKKNVKSSPGSMTEKGVA